MTVRILRFIIWVQIGLASFERLAKSHVMAHEEYLRSGGTHKQYQADFHSIPYINNKHVRREMTSETGTGRAFDYLDSADIYQRLHELAQLYPNFVTLQNSQDAYGLQSAGTSTDCPFDGISGCANWILTIEDKTLHNKTSQSWKEIPEVLLSGCVHGDERVGPTVVVETATLLLEAASCEASIQSTSLLYMKNTDCRTSLQEDWDVTDRNTRQWLARLVATRRIVVVPTANALGYYRNERTEDLIDPNRDFPYDLDPSNPYQNYGTCMQTIAARTLNEVFRQHLIQLSFTFHAGMEAIGYEWGAPSYLEAISPDDAAQNALASRFSWYGGSFNDPKSQGGQTYQYGDMNGMVYPVRGGMEDWAYAASWDKSKTEPCFPSTYGGYDSNKTIYNDSTLRTFNMLVETSVLKTPQIGILGSTLDLFSPNNIYGGNGHVSRNLRLSLLLIDMVQPYLSISKVDGQAQKISIVPAAKSLQGLESCLDMMKQEIYSTSISQTVSVEWTIGGALEVDETSLVFGKLEDIVSLLLDDLCLVQPTNEQWTKLENAIADPSTSIQQTNLQTNGITRWSAYNSGSGLPQDPTYQATIPMDGFSGGDVIVGFAVAKVDSSWSKAPEGITMTPQSHIVNARTNTSWFHESSGKVIKGRNFWISLPIALEISSSSFQNAAKADIQSSETYDVGSDSASIEDAKSNNTKANVDNSFVLGIEGDPVEGPQMSHPSEYEKAGLDNSSCSLRFVSATMILRLCTAGILSFVLSSL